MKKYVNIIFGSGEWKYNHRKEFHKAIANEMSDFAETIVIDAPVSLSVNLFLKFRDRFLSYIKGNLKPKIIENGITLFTPIILTHLFFWKKINFSKKIDSKILKIQIQKFLKNHNYDQKKMLWVYLPEHLEFSKLLNPDFLIYDSYDDNEYDYFGNKLKKETDLNKKLVERSNLTLCVAKFTFDRFKKYNENVIYLPNGNSFKTIYRNSNYKKNELEKNKPIIGYIGTVRNWIDFNLIEDLLINLIDCKVVFIGLVNRDVKKSLLKLKKYKNFLHLDFIEFSKIPSYIKSFDVGIIPFKINNFTKSVFPYKFFEYMAAEIPIVTTPLPEMEKFSDVIGFSKDNNAFIENCSDAVNGKFKDKIKKYSDIANENSWENRAKEISEKIILRLREKSNE